MQFDRLTDRRLVDLLLKGAVGVLPSDTVYGLVAKAALAPAVTRLYSLKNRHNQPGTIIAGSIEQLVELGLKARYFKPVQSYWPNPISIIIPSEPALSYLDMSKGTLAVRIPSHKDLRQLLLQTGPLMTSSANSPGEPTANNLAQAQAYFADKVDFYVDGGDLSDRPASTIIRVVDDAVEILREGAVKINPETGEIIK